ncbi:MAG: hypothetical protein K2I64_07405 [Muribaculaceae bacterium]|nr:hypothetical protein [Muribaculaceae bacterium]
MIRGVIPFYCSECGNRFIAIDVELGASVFSAPVRCGRCGSMHTRPWSILPAAIANRSYKAIWKKMDEEAKGDL